MSKPTILQIAMSILAAFVGVQSDKNRKLDFDQGTLLPYVVAGLIFTIIFISTIVFIVSRVVGD